MVIHQCFTCLFYQLTTSNCFYGGHFTKFNAHSIFSMIPQLRSTAGSPFLEAKMKWFLLTLLILFASSGLAQNQSQSIRLTPEVYVTTEDTLTIQVVLSSGEEINFQPPTKLNKSHPSEVYWIRVDLTKYESTLKQAVEWELSIGSFDKSSLYYETPDGIQELKFGYFSPLGTQKRTLFDPNTYFKPKELISGRYVYLKVRKLTGFLNMSSIRLRLTPKPVIDARNDGIFFDLLKRNLPAYVFAGLVIIVLLFSISAFIIQKRKEYLFYSFYLLALLAYLARRPFGLDDTLFGQYPLLEYTAHMEFQVLINLCYTLFAKHFLSTQKDYPKLDRLINLVVMILIIFIIADLLVIATGHFGTHLIMMNAERYFMATFGILGSVYLLVKRKSPLVLFIVVGSFAYTLGALGMLFLFQPNYMLLGSSIEVFVFTLGLGYKSRSILMENARIQREVLQVEMKALRAQMNPHFIFNSLGSIQHLIRRDLKKEALQYLSRFSQLLRQILDNSSNGMVSLKDEIELLRNYIELESLRFNGRFGYELTVSESLDIYNLEVPVLLIQPHIENAILHGLLPKKDAARLDIHFADDGDTITCTVRDNGIGRQKSAELKSIRGVTHQSRGLSIVAERVNNLHGKKSDRQLIQIDDIFDAEKTVVGTLVSISIPKDE